MRSEVAKVLTLACHSAACAPPPAGTGGSSKGGGGSAKKSRDMTAEELDRWLPTDVRAWRPSTDRSGKSTKSTTRRPAPKRRRQVGARVAKKLREAISKLDPANIKAIPANPEDMGWSRDTSRGLPEDQWPAAAR